MSNGKNLYIPTAVVKLKKEISKFAVVASAYNSLPEQTDATPWITSTGDSVFWGGIAVSRPMLSDSLLPYGSVVRIEGFLHPFIVFDTMNFRYKNYRIDIWFPEKHEAVEFGVRKKVITKLGRLPKSYISNFYEILANIYLANNNM